MKKKALLIGLVLLICAMFSVTVSAEEIAMAAEVNTFINSFWSLVPALVAIVLMLATLLILRGVTAKKDA